MHDMSALIHNMNTLINNQKTEIATLTRNQNTKVHFTASLSRRLTLAGSQVLTFDHVITNVGGGYNASTGRFTCPVDGYYLFEMHILGQADKFTNFQLWLNQQRVVVTETDDLYDYQSASNSAILQLQRGDSVRVVSGAGHSSYADGYVTHAYTTFTGTLLSLT